jgi:hypothetical protein
MSAFDTLLVNCVAIEKTEAENKRGEMANSGKKATRNAKGKLSTDANYRDTDDVHNDNDSDNDADDDDHDGDVTIAKPQRRTQPKRKHSKPKAAEATPTTAAANERAAKQKKEKRRSTKGGAPKKKAPAAGQRSRPRKKVNEVESETKTNINASGSMSPAHAPPYASLSSSAHAVETVSKADIAAIVAAALEQRLGSASGIGTRTSAGGKRHHVDDDFTRDPNHNGDDYDDGSYLRQAPKRHSGRGRVPAAAHVHDGAGYAATGDFSGSRRQGGRTPESFQYLPLPLQPGQRDPTDIFMKGFAMAQLAHILHK